MISNGYSFDSSNEYFISKKFWKKLVIPFGISRISICANSKKKKKKRIKRGYRINIIDVKNFVFVIRMIR